VAAVAAEFEGKIRFLGVPGRGEIDEMRDFVSDTGMEELTHVVDEDGSLWQRFGVFGQPAFAFVGADGSSRTFAGSMDSESLRQAATELVGS